MKLQCQSLDRISSLPQDTIEKILTHMPIRDALRTSILSKKWRYCWTTMPKLVFDEYMVELLPDHDHEDCNKYKLVSAIFHVLLLHRAPILEFSLSAVDFEIYSEIDQIILHLSRSNNNNIKKFILEVSASDPYLLPFSFFSLQGLEHLDLSNCAFELPLMNKKFSMLKSLRFYDIYVSCKIVQGFLTNCPLLEEFSWIKEHGNIELTDCELVELFKCLPSIQVLKIFDLSIKHLGVGGMPHKLPNPTIHLRILQLCVCFLELSTVLCVISNSPNLEKIELKWCWNHDGCLQQTFNSLLDPQDYSGLSLDHLKELEMIGFHNHAPEMEFVKLIMAKSPVLKKAQIQLDKSVSAGNEIKMLRDLLHFPFPRASPTVNFVIKRPITYREIE